MPAPKDPAKYEEWRRNISTGHKGQVHTPESNAKRSAKLKGRSNADTNSHSEEARAKRSTALKGRVAPNRINIDDNQLIEWYVNQKITATEIAQRLHVSWPTVCQRLRTLGIMRSNSDSHKGKRPSNYKERTLSTSGYMYVHLSKDSQFYPMAGATTGKVAEHRLVMAQRMGRCLESWEIVHHKNHVKTDNRIENLELIQSQTHHQAETLTHTHMLKLKEENKLLRERICELEKLIEEKNAALKAHGIVIEQSKE